MDSWHLFIFLVNLWFVVWKSYRTWRLLDVDSRCQAAQLRLDLQRIAGHALHRVAVAEIQTRKLFRSTRSFRALRQPSPPHHVLGQLDLDRRHGLDFGQEELFERVGHQADVFFRLVVEVTVSKHQLDVIHAFFARPEKEEVKVQLTWHENNENKKSITQFVLTMNARKLQ